MGTGLKDSLGRQINYLRLAVTDRCNLSCTYCTPASRYRLLPKSDILTYEEMERLVSLFITRGINKVRLTGGEPLVRRGVLEFARRMKADLGIPLLALTTNGLSLEAELREILRAGITHINVSLDTLDQQMFSNITGRNDLKAILRGIESAREAGLQLKINSVILRAINEDQVVPLALLSKAAPIQVRFIERMPFGRLEDWSGEFVSADEVISILRNNFELLPATESLGLSHHFKIPGHQGSVALIAPVSRRFCDKCNRLRLTPDGQIKTCLLSDGEVDLRGPLREGADDSELMALINSAVASKKKSYLLEKQESATKHRRGMRSIGG